MRRLELLRARHAALRSLPDRPHPWVVDALAAIALRSRTPRPDPPTVVAEEPAVRSSWVLTPPPHHAAPEQRRMLAAVVLIG